MSSITEQEVLICRKIKDALQMDLVSVGELRQIVLDTAGREGDVAGFVRKIVRQLLTGNVEIGEACNVEGGYVKFVAWRGSVGERCERARLVMRTCQEDDQGFAFWLCLRDNVDEYEA